MSLCRYDISKPCENHGTSSRTCLDCVLGKIRAEIEQSAFKDVNGSMYIFVNSVNQIIDKYKESEE